MEILSQLYSPLGLKVATQEHTNVSTGRQVNKKNNSYNGNEDLQ